MLGQFTANLSNFATILAVSAFDFPSNREKSLFLGLYFHSNRLSAVISFSSHCSLGQVCAPAAT